MLRVFEFGAFLLGNVQAHLSMCLYSELVKRDSANFGSLRITGQTGVTSMPGSLVPRSLYI